MESILFSLNSTNDLAKKICNILQMELGEIRNQKFSDGELSSDFISSVRGKRIYLLSTVTTAEDVLILNFAIDAAKRSSAKEIIPILPVFPYQRSDKKDYHRGCIGGKVIAEMIEQRGATSIITFDLHADQIQAFFNIPVIHIEGKNVFDKHIQSIYTENTILAGPDAGSGKRIKRMKDQLKKYYDIDVSYVMLDKTRKAANVVSSMVIIGDVVGKDVIIIDDIIDTASTVCMAANELVKNGANSVRAIMSHGILSGNALEKIGESALLDVIVSDSLPLPDSAHVCASGDYNETRCYNIKIGENKLKVISVTNQIAKAINAIDSDISYESIKNK